MTADRGDQVNQDLMKTQVYERLIHAFSAAEFARRELAIRLASDQAPKSEVDWMRGQFQKKVEDFSQSVQNCLDYLKSSIVLNGKRKIRL